MTSEKVNCEPCRELRIYKVEGALCADIKNISSHKGITANKLLLQALSDIANSYPDEMKVKKISCMPVKEIRVRGIGKALREQLKNIAHNMGVSLYDLCEVKLHDVVVSYPADMKTPIEK